ncbi:MAG: sugar phosphate isomerase/epimerase [Rubrobacter sp.]|nr:sugar phosphate isomerase/epimerase [Rubrobacter sp.]
MRRAQIALQMYTVREHAGRDMPDTLRQLASMGYHAVELAGYGGLGARELRAVLDEYGLRAASAHVSFEEWKDPELVLTDLDTLGCSHAVVPMMTPEYRESEAAVARFAGELNRLGEASERKGVEFAYHNHDFEFASLGEETAWDVLVRETDPRLVGLELDVYWARYAGVDPEILIPDLADRISLLHLKDMAPGDKKPDAPVGEGTMPWDGLLAAGDAAGVEWYIVEQDHPRDAFEDVRRSLRNLEQMADG